MNRRCEFIAAKKSHHATIEARRVVGVSKSSWYRWEAGAAARAHKQESNGGLARRIRQVWLESGKAYGVPRITAQLRDEGWVVNHKRVRRLTRQLGIVSCMPYRPPRTTQRGSGPIAEDLLARVFQTEQPNRAWVTDITFIRTREGWLYLAAYIDLFSRRVVGYSLSSSCDTQLVLDALRRGLRERRPGEGLIAHSDQGCQYTSRDYLRELRRFGIRPSMAELEPASTTRWRKASGPRSRRSASRAGIGTRVPKRPARSTATSVGTTRSGCIPPSETLHPPDSRPRRRHDDPTTTGHSDQSHLWGQLQTEIVRSLPGRVS